MPQADAIRSLFEEVPDGLLVTGPEGRFVDANPAVCQLLGYAREDLLGRHMDELFPPEDFARLEQAKDLLRRGGVERGEWRFRRKDGALVSVELTASVLTDGRWQAIVRDVSERQRMERELARSRADLNRAQCVARTGSWRLDTRAHELLWTDQTYRIFGLPPATPVTYERFLDCVHPDDRAAVDRAWKAALHGAPYDVEHRIVRRGATRWVRELADLEFDEQGELIGGIGTVQDVDERHRMEERLAASEARARAIVEVSPIAIVSVDEEQRIVAFNRGAEEMFGWSEAEILGQPLDVLIPARFHEQHRQHVRDFAESGQTSRMLHERAAVRGLRRDGREFVAEGGISQVVAGGKVMTAMLRDVTDKVRALEEEAFLADVGALLPASMDIAVTLQHVGELAVRTLADACIVDLLEGGRVGRWKTFLRDPARAASARGLERIGGGPSRAHPWAEVLRSGRPLLVDDVTPESLERAAPSPEHLRLLRELAPRSAMAHPLVARERVLGVIVLLSTGRPYEARDMRLAGELASRAALALDNAGLLRASEEANATLRETVARLEAARRTIATLTDLLPVCAWCKRVREDEAGRWVTLESYLERHSGKQVSHGICAECAGRFGASGAPPS